MDSREKLERIIGNRNGLLDSKKQKKESRIDSLLYGTLLDAQCKNALSTQRLYREYFRPVKKNLPNRKKELEIEVENRPNRPNIITRIHKYKGKILSALKESPAIIIKGGTGTGKTTQIPQMLMEISSQKIIGCTQPRRAAAISIAERMEKETEDQAIGHSVRFSTKRGNRIKYMTEGILLREIVHDRRLSRYSIIILDEIHEGTVESLILVKYLLLLIRERTDLKIVLMSATLEDGILQEIGLFPIIEISGTEYPIDISYLNEPSKDYIASIAEKAQALSETSKNILVFLTGVEDIQIIYHLLADKMPEYTIFTLHSKMSVPEQMAAIKGEGPKCVLSTNIAETSLTIPDVEYVIDCGMHKKMVYDSVRNVRMMKIVPIQKAQAVQRAGRTGRTLKGTCFRMYTEKEFESLRAKEVTRLEIENMEYYIFMLVQLGLPVSSHVNIKAAIARMERFGVIKEFKLTSLAHKILKLPLPVLHSTFLLEGKKRGCAWEIAVILGMMEATNNLQSIKIEECIKHTEVKDLYGSDHILLLHLYKKSQVQGKSLQISTEKVKRIVNQLCNIINAPNRSICLGDPYKLVLDSLIASHRYNVCIRTAGRKYKEMWTGVECMLPTNTLAHKADSLPTYLIYNEIVEIQSPLMSIVTEVSAERMKDIQTSENNK